MVLDRQTQIELYTTMLTIRRFEERVASEFYAGNIIGFIHSYIGQEAIATGVCKHLTTKDRIVSHHRGHGHCIAKGADMKRMMAEIYGKKTGYCKGKGGSMHIADFSIGMLGADGIVGGRTAHRHRRGPGRPAGGRGERRRRVLRRRGLPGGRVPRGAQPGRHLEAAHCSSSARTTTTA